ncbi:hypothetical protein CDCA_CDCA01G0007 [Cyanidium caldarium]|uniref:Transposase n=1 Tax=Cyanidium caldarium TaxID=2771 RepID=A0AAV9INQ0_CYACA|nr:hypothetical protein CDCA_CDCA01G0007 [Cyanidium caldarium]
MRRCLRHKKIVVIDPGVGHALYCGNGVRFLRYRRAQHLFDTKHYKRQRKCERMNKAVVELDGKPEATLSTYCACSVTADGQRQWLKTIHDVEHALSEHYGDEVFRRMRRQFQCNAARSYDRFLNRFQECGSAGRARC